MTNKSLPAVAEGQRPPAIISPSILSADFARLADESKKILDLGADWLHVDVMVGWVQRDRAWSRMTTCRRAGLGAWTPCLHGHRAARLGLGSSTSQPPPTHTQDGHFVPNLTLGPPIVKSLRAHTDGFLDCHLMVSRPAQWVADFAAAGADMYTFHLEAVDPGAGVDSPANPEVVALIAAVHAAGMLAGITIKPGTPVQALAPYLDDVDMVLIMTVEPGFGGQKFMPEMMDKVAWLRARRPGLFIEVDGGLAPATIDAAAAAGANVIVAGSAVFGAERPGDAIATLRRSVQRGGAPQES